MPRSGFSAKFTEVIGTSVKQYLIEWRMNLARVKILQSPVPLTEMAEELGTPQKRHFRELINVYLVFRLCVKSAKALTGKPKKYELTINREV